MIEFILGAFLWAKTEIYFKLGKLKITKKEYMLYSFFKNWLVYILPLLCLILYIIFDVSAITKHYWYKDYQNSLKFLTLFCYLPLIKKYELYVNNKIYNSSISFILSPAMIAIYCVIIGITLNIIVMRMNNNLMPVLPTISNFTGYFSMDLINDGKHILYNSNIRYPILIDWIDLGFTMMSPGDAIFRFYPFIIITSSIKKSCKIIK